MEDITIDELKSRQANNENLLIIDVREEWEHEEASIDGTKLIPLGDLPFRLEELAGNEDSEIIVHCKTGGRSGQAKKFLEQKGYNKVRNLLGGITAYNES